jgi:hypothetical protein
MMRGLLELARGSGYVSDKALNICHRQYITTLKLVTLLLMGHSFHILFRKGVVIKERASKVTHGVLRLQV